MKSKKKPGLGSSLPYRNINTQGSRKYLKDGGPAVKVFESGSDPIVRTLSNCVTLLHSGHPVTLAEV